MQSSQLELHTLTSKKALPPLGQIRMVNVGIHWCGKWQRYPCCISWRPWARLPKPELTLACNSASKIVIASQMCTAQREGICFQWSEWEKEENVCQSYWRRLTSAKQLLSQSTTTLLDRTWPLKPSFLFLATRRSWRWHNCIAPIHELIRGHAGESKCLWSAGIIS